MALTQAYLITTKNLSAVINSIVSAKSPEHFTIKFLENLNFKSSNDRLYVGMFKALGLLDESGAPTSRYYEFIDQTQTARVLAIGIEEAYEDLFNLRKDAQNLTLDEVKNKLKTLTQGQKSEKVLGLMANTFKSLCDLADWSSERTVPEESYIEREDKKQETKFEEPAARAKMSDLSMNYNIQHH